MSVRCPECAQPFFNELEVQQHVSQTHAEKWEGRNALSQSGDENAVGAVPPDHPDTIATRGGWDRPDPAVRQTRKETGAIPGDDAEARAEARNRELVEHPEDR